MSDEKRLIKMTILHNITVDNGYEGEEGQTFEDYKIKGNLLISRPFESAPKDDRKLLIKIYAYAYKEEGWTLEGWSGKIIEEVVLRKLEFEWEVDKRMCEPHKWLAEIVRDFLGDNICVKSWRVEYFGSIGTFLSNVDFTFENELEMFVDSFDFLRFCNCFKKIDEKLTKQYVRRYRIG